MTGRPPSPLPYTEARERHTLVRREPDRGVVAILLRPGTTSATRDALRSIGFRPESTTDASAATWIGDLDGDLGAVHRALGSEALFDLGPVFHDVNHVLEAAPARWPGRFVLHVGGTPRCLVFEDIARRDLEPLVKREVEDYFVKEWAPTTE